MAHKLSIFHMLSISENLMQDFLAICSSTSSAEKVFLGPEGWCCVVNVNDAPLLGWNLEMSFYLSRPVQLKNSFYLPGIARLSTTPKQQGLFFNHLKMSKFYPWW